PPASRPSSACSPPSTSITRGSARRSRCRRDASGEYKAPGAAASLPPLRAYRPPARRWHADRDGSEPMSTPEFVNVVIDGRDIQVPKGIGMVEAALGAGIEIPVFCYEPRLGPPVGACRMCLCEVEGMP